MSNRKIKVLWESEASFLATGFSSYSLEILKRLYSTEKFEIAEFGSYARPDDGRQLSVPWKFYGVLPTNSQEEQVYHSKNTNQFGEWKLEQVLLDFQPNIVISSRDHWMCEYIDRSVFRPYFKWLYMTCIDSTPLKTEWIQTYSNADGVLSYTQWGLDVCRYESGGKAKILDYVGAGADDTLFKPVPDKRAHKASCGIDPDTNIILSVMRNQKRKLFPDLIYAFGQFLQMADEETAKKTYLYLHTSYPDVGFDIPKLLQRYKVASRVLFTYRCRSCGLVYPSFFRDGVTLCPRCNQYSSTMSNTSNGVPRESMPAIYNLADIYVQHAICEGLSIPVLEAASAGIPFIAPAYSATKELCERLKGIATPIKKYYHEPETDCIRTYPDNEDLVRELINFFGLPESTRRKMGETTRNLANELYSYDRAAKIWEQAIENTEILSPEHSWLSPPRIHQPTGNMPQCSNADFVRWGIANIWGRPEMVNSQYANELIKFLNYGCVTDGPERGRLFNRDNVMQNLLALNQQFNAWEQNRYNTLVNSEQKKEISYSYV